jgi:endosialidase-like protein
MILGRQTPSGRIVKVWDYLEVNGGLTYTSQLNKLDVADNFTATVRCGDFCIGHSGRRGSPGRALVDYIDTLHLNYGPDWPKTRINGAVSYGSSREYKDNFAELNDDDAFELLAQLSPVRFTFKGDRDKEPQIGFIAEDVPRDIATSDRKGISPMSIIGILTSVVKRQQKMILKMQKAV